MSLTDWSLHPLLCDNTGTPRPTVEVEVAATFLGFSRSCAYDAVRDGRIPSIRLSPRRIVVPVPLLLELIGASGSPAVTARETSLKATG